MSTPVTLRPMAAGDILDAAFGLYRKHFRTQFIIVAMVNVPLLALSLGLSLVTPLSAALPSAAQFGLLAATSMLSIIAGLLSFAANVLQTSALVQAVSEQYFGRPVTWRQAYRQTFRHGASLLVGSILLGVTVGVIVACSIFMCFVPAIVLLPPLLTRWLFMYQGIMLEDLDAVESLRRSWHLVRGQFWRTLGIGLALGVLYYLISIGPTYLVLFLALSLSGAEWIILLSSALSGVISMLFTPVLVGSLTILYYDLRMRQEGFDLLWLANEIAPLPAA
jgi:uncharacterized membrane protein YesL